MHNPNFGSGPCAKRPAWSLDVLKSALVGRSHRSTQGRKRLKDAIETTKNILKIPTGYLVGIMPGSDTGAFEAAMWNLLGSRPVTVLSWESFGEGWVYDIAEQLKLKATVRSAPYGKIPDLRNLDWSSDVVFVANGTTSGVKVPHWEWIPNERNGLSLCDATSAVFAMPMDWEKLDATTFSWQKCLGGEAAHGMLVLGPRAVQRIESYEPSWPMPKLFRIKKSGRIDGAIFEGDVINTPSMLCVEDYLDALSWAEGIGLDGLIARSEANLRLIEDWVGKNPWITFLAEDKKTRSSTSVCLRLADGQPNRPSPSGAPGLLKMITGQLSQNAVAYDIDSYRDAPPGIRLWCGPTVEQESLKLVLAEIERIYRKNKEDELAKSGKTINFGTAL